MSVPRTRGFHRETGDRTFWSYCLPGTCLEGSQTPGLTSEAQECWFWLPDTVPENSGSHLVISLSDRLGRGPTRFHLQQLALRSWPLPELRQTAGLASSTKCFSGTAPCLVSCSALKNFRVYWASLHNWLHQVLGSALLLWQQVLFRSLPEIMAALLAPGNFLCGSGWSAFAPF